MSPLFKICDYSSGSLAEHAMLKMEVDKPKLDSKNLNFSVENGIIKMDKKTQNQYFSSYVKVQVLSLSHRCKVKMKYIFDIKFQYILFISIILCPSVIT